MPVEIAAYRGVRFPDLEEEISGEAEHEAYSEARTQVTLGAGESAQIEIRTDFEPESVIVDPDAVVLQLRREFARADLGGGV